MSSLLRLQDNSCHVEESERVLMKHKKYSELVVLYRTRGLHKKGQARRGPLARLGVG